MLCAMTILYMICDVLYIWGQIKFYTSSSSSSSSLSYHIIASTKFQRALFCSSLFNQKFSLFCKFLYWDSNNIIVL